MRAANWQRREVTSVEDIGLTDIEAVLAAAEDADSEINFGPGDEQFEPTDDDPDTTGAVSLILKRLNGKR